MFTHTVISLVLAAVVGAVGDTRLPEAAMKGDRALVQSLLKQNVDVNSAQGDGNTSLHWAAYRDDVELARLLLQSGASAASKTRLGDTTPLHLAATNGSAAMIELLVKAGADVNVANGNGTTPLMMAAASGRADAIALLLDRGADVNARDVNHGQTPAMFAAARNRSAAIAVLAQRGADLKLTSKVDVVAPNNSDKQARAEERSKNVAQVGGNSALHFAAREGHLETVQALLANGAGIDQLSATDGMTPLVQAIITGHYDVARYLVDRGANPNLATKKAGLTPLWATIDSRYAPRAWYPSPNVEQEKTSHLELAASLLAHGAKPDARLIGKPWFRTFSDSNGPDPAGSTAFWRAAQANDLDAMKLLVANGANPSIATGHGCSPLQAAAGMQQDFQGSNFVPEARLAVIRYLVEDLAADVNAKDDKGYSVLHAAAFIGKNEIIEYLISRGADVAARANQISNGPSSQQPVKAGNGDTVADMANGWIEKVLQFPDTVSLLIKMGSGFSNTCWASVCVNPTRADRPPKAPQQ